MNFNLEDLMKIKLKRKQAILLILLIAVFIAASSVFFSGQNSYENKTSSVKLGTIQNTLEETGTVYSKRINTFYSDASRRVEVINVSIGDRVKKGTIILTYENDYDLEIERANKQIEAITATYNEAVKGVDFKEISDMKLNISNIETALSAARNHFEKIKSVKDAVDELEYKEAEDNVISLENQLQEAKSSYDLTMEGVSSNEKKQYEEQIEEIITQIKMLEQNIEQASIKAEFDGVITQLNVKQGDMTQTGVPVVEIQDETSLGVYVEVSEEDAARAAIGMPFIISNGKESRKLKIDRINQKHVVSESGSDIPQNLVRIEADLDDASSFKTGSKPVVIIVLEEKKDVLLIDRHALNEKNKKQYVTVIDRGRKVEKEITTGLKNNEYAEVTSGLNENEFVLIE
jgi:HlyD family secretion protein